MRFMQFAAALLGAALAGCGGQSRPLQSHGKPVSHWLEQLNQPDAKARQKAVVALGHVGAADSAAIPALIGAVKDREVTVRRSAVLALLNLGPAAKDAIPVLTESQNDKDATVRTYAAKARMRIQGG